MSSQVVRILELQNLIKFRQEYLEKCFVSGCKSKWGYIPDWSISADRVDDQELDNLYFEIEKVMPESCTQFRENQRITP